MSSSFLSNTRQKMTLGWELAESTNKTGSSLPESCRTSSGPTGELSGARPKQKGIHRGSMPVAKHVGSGFTWDPRSAAF